MLFSADYFEAEIPLLLKFTLFPSLRTGSCPSSYPPQSSSGCSTSSPLCLEEQEMEPVFKNPTRISVLDQGFCFVFLQTTGIIRRTAAINKSSQSDELRS